MFGDVSVEKDFIENFLLTDKNKYRNSFFPEVYPGRKKDENDPGIENWSFWLLIELYQFYQRTGDIEFIEEHKDRVVSHIEGVLSLRGESGLVEGLANKFVDWSLSNKSFALGPISIPINCLIVRMLDEMALLYNVENWKYEANKMRKIIESIEIGNAFFGNSGDGASYVDGKVVPGECQTESGTALKIFSGFQQDDKAHIRQFEKEMGICPVERSNPNIGKSNLFVGFMIRFEVLAKLGKIQTLKNELKNLIYHKSMRAQAHYMKIIILKMVAMVLMEWLVL